MICEGDNTTLGRMEPNVTFFFWSDNIYTESGFNVTYYQVPRTNGELSRSKRYLYLNPFPANTAFGYIEYHVDRLSPINKNEKFKDLLRNFADNYFELYDESERNGRLSDVRDAIFFNQTTVQLNGHQKRDFIVQCSFDDELCGSINFTEYEDPTYGKCFTFMDKREFLCFCYVW